MPRKSAREYRFVTPLPLGFSMELNGQRFEVVAIRPHERKDGSLTDILTWEAGCLECGQLFRVELGRTMLPGSVLRCAEHRTAWPFGGRKSSTTKKGA